MFELTVAVDTASGYRGDWQQHTEVVRETEKNIINKGTHNPTNKNLNAVKWNADSSYVTEYKRKRKGEREEDDA